MDGFAGFAGFAARNIQVVGVLDLLHLFEFKMWHDMKDNILVMIIILRV